jgi:hypothetical protein
MCMGKTIYYVDAKCNARGTHRRLMLDILRRIYQNKRHSKNKSQNTIAVIHY